MSLRVTSFVAVALIAVLAVLPSASAATPPFVFPDGCCFYNDRTVRTVVPPSTFDQEGRDNFYAFPSGGATGQMPIVAVAPGDIEYHGGHWRFFAVIWNADTTPTLLTSEAAVLAAMNAEQVTVTRVPANDFLCPIQF